MKTAELRSPDSPFGFAQGGLGRLSLRERFWATGRGASLDRTAPSASLRAGLGGCPYVSVFGPDTKVLPAIKKRSGSFAALVIPIRAVVTI
jgi:hypothetical protein